ncbi:MAG TPA: hypothetical protein VG245_02795 [Candidatus Dormibacteraeota bacterium]|jgi:hypothetical protein|nr:hypothetical protein [Candidatus Dormibacteraeota bacterium]
MIVKGFTNAVNPENVDSSHLLETGEGTGVKIVLIPHRSLGGVALGVWVDEQEIRIVWASVTDLSSHDQIDLGLTCDHIEIADGWEARLRACLGREFAGVLLMTVRRRLYRRVIRCTVNVGKRTKTWTIGQATPSTPDREQQTSLAGGRVDGVDLPVPIDRWRTFA